MQMSNFIKINSSSIKSNNNIPFDDFVNEQFDSNYEIATSNTVLIFSTQRSGSTLFCHFLHKNADFVAHEYFHPYVYMPLLANRWNCIHKNILNEKLYVQNLLKFRTNQKGWLGINLHGSQIKYYLRMEKYFLKSQMYYIHIIRRDIISQAISYEIASQSGVWSSHFKASAHPVYNYNNILEKLISLQSQNALITAFLKSKNITYQTIYYEDFLVNPKRCFIDLPCIDKDASIEQNIGLQKQSTFRNKKWEKRFINEYLKSFEHTKAKLIKRIKGKVRQLITK